jgi:hypothetical protein
MPKARTKGVFCLEGDWYPDLRRPTTVGPVLDLLEKSNIPPVPSIRRDTGTVPELEYYLQKWTQQRYARYPILYLGFHGSPGELHLGSGPGESVNLDWLEDRLAGKCKGRVIHFGSCGTLATHGNRLNRFLERTGTLAVCGYKAEVDWMLSTAFEIILLSGFQRNTLTRPGMAAVQRRVRSQAARLVRDLKFRMVIAPRKSAGRRAHSSSSGDQG